jgi:hypothetical protein
VTALPAHVEIEAEVEERVARIVQVMDEAGGSPHAVAYGYLESFVQQHVDGKVDVAELNIQVHLIRTALNLYGLKQRERAERESRRGVQRYRGSLTGDRT